MTRTYALIRLLEHGPLKFGEIVEITGWSFSQAWSAIADLQRLGKIVSVGGRPAIYQLEVVSE